MPEVNNFFSELITHRDFKDVRERLKEEGVPDIKYNKTRTGYEEYMSMFDETLKEFFSISGKNKVNGLKYLFIDTDNKVEVENIFAIDKLFEKYTLDESSNNNKKIELLLPYIKELKYGSKMIEPLVKVVENPYTRMLHLSKRDSEEFEVEIFQFNYYGKELEIIEPCQVFKNPIYGLLHYINCEPVLFRGKTIKVDRINITTIGDSFCSKYANFFRDMEFTEYEYELNVKDSTMTCLSFYKTEVGDHSKRKLLSFELKNEFIVELTTRGGILKELLELLNKKSKSMDIHYGADNNIDICINGRTEFSIENNVNLFKDIMFDICDEEEPGLFASILGIFCLKSYIHATIMKSDFYYSKFKKNQIIYELKRLI